MKAEVLGRTLWGTRFGGGYGPVQSQYGLLENKKNSALSNNRTLQLDVTFIKFF
jgi:hypothetical protein